MLSLSFSLSSLPFHSTAIQRTTGSSGTRYSKGRRVTKRTATCVAAAAEEAAAAALGAAARAVVILWLLLLLFFSIVFSEFLSRQRAISV